jgi:peptide/nickel transport system permease protein
MRRFPLTPRGLCGMFAALGVGTQPPEPSWGLMLSSTGRAFMEQAPWLAVFPGLAISLAVFGFNLFGDTLRDAWDPKLRRQG